MAVLSVETKKVSELDAASAVAASDNFIVDTALNGTQKVTFGAALDSLKSALNVPASANTLLSNESISTTFENEPAKVAASSTVYAAEKRLSNTEKDLLFMQGAVAYNSSWVLADLLTAIRSGDPKAYSLGDYITVDSQKWVVVAKNYYTANNFTNTTYQPHAVLMLYGTAGSQVYNSTNTNTGGYNGSALKTWLEDTFYNSLPSVLRACILPINVTESTMGSQGTFTRYIQIPSVIQITGTAQYAEPTRVYGLPFSVVHNPMFLSYEGNEFWTSTPVNGSTTNFATFIPQYQCSNSGQSRYARTVRPFIVIG